MIGYVDSLALEDGRILIENNQLIDAGGESPYIEKEVHLAALATERVIVNTSYQLVANGTFLLDNLTTETVTGYTIQNLTTGQTVNLSVNGTAGISFTALGVHQLKITLNTNKGNYISFQKIEVLPSGVRLRSGEANSVEPEDRLLTSTIPFKGYSETTSTISHADYHIYYHFKDGDTTKSERILNKPIIIVDGFDPMDDRNYAKIYDELLRYYNGTNSVKLGDELRLKGYDVIILNFPILGTRRQEPNKTNIDIPLINGSSRDGGADYIERNAFLLVKLIQELNAELQSKGSSEKLVVVGPSMGGQISRYALAYMEKKEAEGVPNMNHNTRLWLSFDSPHLGANIPLALQKDLHFFAYTGGEQTAKKAYNERLYSVAARQMLIEQLNRWGVAKPTEGQNGTAEYHQRYYAALKNNGLPGSGGWPTKSRNVTLVNGNGSGITTHQPSNLFLSLDAYKTIFNIRVVKIRNRFMPHTGSTNLLFEGSVASAGFLSLIIDHSNMSVTNVNQRGAMDIVQGGTFNTQATIKDEFSRGLRESKAKVTRQNWSMMDNHSFIPTVSALGFKNPSFNWNARINNRDLVQTGEIPFDNYFIPSKNQEHVSLTEESVGWFMSQLDGNYYNRTGEMTISGPSSVCDQATYTINRFDVLPDGATVQWSVPINSLRIISGQGTSTLVVGKSGISDVVSISARISVGGNEIEINKAGIQVGSLMPDIALYDAASHMRVEMGHIGNTYYFEAYGFGFSNHNGDYSWKITPSNPDEYLPIQGSGRRVYYTPFVPGFYTVTLNYNGECGWSDSGVVKRYYFDERWRGGNIIQLYPNPTTDMVTVEFQEEQLADDGVSVQRITTVSNPGPYEIQLWSSSAMLRRYTTDQPVYHISVSGLPAGIYFVRIIKDGETHTKRLIKR